MTLAPCLDVRAAAPRPTSRVCPPTSRLLRLPASTGGLPRASGDRLHFPTPDSEVRQQKGEEGDTTLDLVLKHLDVTIVIYI